MDTMLRSIREVHRLRLDKLVHLGVTRLARVEWRESNNHFVGQDAEGPPVDGVRVADLLQDFRSEILRSTAEGVRLLVLSQNLGEAEIGKQKIAILVQQNILRLEIPINNLLLVEVAEGQGDAQTVELGSLLRELSRLSKMHKQLAASDKLHDEEDLEVGLEDELHAHEERMVGLLQNIFLKHGRLNLIVVQNDIFSERLHCKHCLGVLLLHQEHFSETALANNLLDFERVQICRLLILFKTSLENCHGTALRELGVGLLQLGLMNVLRIGLRCSSNCTAALLRVYVLSLDPRILHGLHLSILLNICLLRRELVNTIFDRVDWQIRPFNIPVVILDLLEDVITLVRIKLVVVLACHVDDEARCSLGVRTLGERFDI